MLAMGMVAVCNFAMAEESVQETYKKAVADFYRPTKTEPTEPIRRRGMTEELATYWAINSENMHISDLDRAINDFNGTMIVNQHRGQSTTVTLQRHTVAKMSQALEEESEERKKDFTKMVAAYRAKYPAAEQN